MNELSVVIPCVSSVDMLPQFIDELATCLMSNPSDIDIIVVANEKIHSIGRVVRHIQKKYPWLKFKVLERLGDPRNYGALVRFGVAYSTSRYIVLVSPYGEDDVSIIPSMLNKIRKGAQVVQATRFSSTDTIRNVQLKFRIYQNIYRFFIRFLLGFRISDSTYGFKMFDRTFIQSLGLNQNGYSICPEITLKALLAGGRVEYISSGTKSVPIKRDFSIYKEGLGYIWLLIRGFAHRKGILWF